MKDLIEEVAQDLIEENPDNYNPQWADYGYINNGVGWVCCGGEYTYDEDQAREDAKEKLLESLDMWAGKIPELPDIDIQKYLEVEEIYNFIKHLIEVS